MPCIRTCRLDKQKQNPGEVMSKQWEKWDLRILALYILVSQVYLHFFGRRRTKSKSAAIMIVSISLLYLLSDLLATTALGKLSKLAVNKKFPTNTTDNSTMTTINTIKKTMGNATVGKEMLRVMWGPLILFYLGGPDTITVLNLQENQMWMKHFIGLFTQGFRAVYALIATWSFSQEKPWSIQGLISLLALFILIPGIIKYGERVWIIKSRNKHDRGFIQLQPRRVRVKDSRPNAKRVLLAYFCIQTLVPHRQDYVCKKGRVRHVTTNFLKSARKDSYEAFKLMEIELGLIYDMLFSKIGTIFTIWGSILRFFSFSFLISVLVVFLRTLMRDKLPNHFKGDDVITIILLAGAVFLDLAGIVVQLKSDWALVWACNIDRIKWGVTPVLFLHENLISDRETWSGFMGQLSLREFCKTYKSNKTWESLFGKEKLLKRFSSQTKPDKHLKDLIFRSLCEISKKRATSGVRRAEWILVSDDLAQQFKWSNELEFSQWIVIWHVATEVCYWSDPGNVDTNVCAVKMLSDYMMYLLVAYASRFPFCYISDGGGKRNICDEIMDNHNLIKELFNGGESLSYGQEGAEKKGNTIYTTLMKAHVQRMKENRNRWDIMGRVWVETLRHAARECPVNQHIEELRRGGEFFTHVWLLLMHLRDSEKLERSKSSRVDEHDSTPEDSKKDKNWDLTKFWGKTCGKIPSA